MSYVFYILRLIVQRSSMITYPNIPNLFYTRSVKDPATENHNHGFWEIIIVLSGSITHVINGNTETLSANCVLFLRPYKDCHYYVKQNGNKYLHRDIYISPSDMEKWCGLLSNSLYEKLYSPKDPVSFSIPSISINHMESLFLSHSFEFSHDIQLYKDLQFTTTITLLTAFRISQLVAAMPSWIKLLIQEMKNPTNFCTSIEKLTATTHYSHCHVCKEFKKYTGQTILSFFIEQKINYASYLLANTNMKILDISNSIGYDSSKNFISQFTKVFHLSPSKWRTKNQIVIKK